MNGTESATAPESVEPESVAASAPVSDMPANESIPEQAVTNGEPLAGIGQDQISEEVKLQAGEGEVQAQDTVMGGTS
jgi:hypothetical protein